MPAVEMKLHQNVTTMMHRIMNVVSSMQGTSLGVIHIWLILTHLLLSAKQCNVPDTREAQILSEQGATSSLLETQLTDALNYPEPPSGYVTFILCSLSNPMVVFNSVHFSPTLC